LRGSRAINSRGIAVNLLVSVCNRQPAHARSRRRQLLNRRERIVYTVS
jgi:hypothetical protein